MNRFRPGFLYLPLILVTGMFFLTGCEDGNLFGKLYERGESSDAESLNADATIALRERNYTEALALFERVLDQDPNNSIALNGAAKAAVGAAGLNFGQIVANILAQTNNAPSIHGIADFVDAGIEVRAASTVDPDSLLHAIDLDALDAALD